MFDVIGFMYSKNELICRTPIAVQHDDLPFVDRFTSPPGLRIAVCVLVVLVNCPEIASHNIDPY